jgi:hypothetical protein
MFLGLVFMATGMLTLLQGKLHYSNYWGAPVFAPFAILIGILLVVFAFRSGKGQNGNRE